jgi:hypothetical protein
MMFCVSFGGAERMLTLHSALCDVQHSSTVFLGLTVYLAQTTHADQDIERRLIVDKLFKCSHKGLDCLTNTRQGTRCSLISEIVRSRASLSRLCHAKT